MRFKVPQDVQREDQILWILTLRQVITLLVGFGVSYVLFSSLRKQYELHQMEIIMIWIPAGISAALAFLKIKGISLGKFILLLIEQKMFRAPRRKWVPHGGEPFISLTTPFSMKNKKKAAPINAEKDVSEKKIKKIAAILDSSGTSGLEIKNKK
ncbi:PrgI family protein [Candidatus Gracilibacteria bacterium]|nr:PrgI family protein [Candidatus Gracilibacteria bacterium]